MKLLQTLFPPKEYIYGKLTVFTNCIDVCDTIKKDCRIGKTFAFMTKLPYGSNTIETVLNDIGQNGWVEYGNRIVNKKNNVIVKVRKKNC